MKHKEGKLELPPMLRDTRKCQYCFTKNICCTTAISFDSYCVDNAKPTFAFFKESEKKLEGKLKEYFKALIDVINKEQLESDHVLSNKMRKIEEAKEAENEKEPEITEEHLKDALSNIEEEDFNEKRREEDLIDIVSGIEELKEKETSEVKQDSKPEINKKQMIAVEDITEDEKEMKRLRKKIKSEGNLKMTKVSPTITGFLVS